MEGSENSIAIRRERAGLKQVELAARLNWSRGQLANIESGNRKVDLPELRLIAKVLTDANPSAPCNVVDLLLPQDAPGMPNETEILVLEEIRKADAYDVRAILAAVKGVMDACRAVLAAKDAPRSLKGEPALARGLADRWNTMDSGAQQKALALLDTAREFSR